MSGRRRLFLGMKACVVSRRALGEEMDVMEAVAAKATHEVPPPEQTKQTDHTIGLPGGQWALWRWVALRSAGFPADEVLSLAFPDCAAAADEVIGREAACDAERGKLLLLIQNAVEAARLECDFATVYTLAKMRRHIKSGRLPATGGIPAIEPALRFFHRASEEAAAGRADFDRVFSACREETSVAVRRIAAAPRFREALTWQNHPLLRTCIEPLLNRGTRARSSKRRQHEELIASYLHRYCVKNDTIGFFGPVGWARFEEHARALHAKAGETLLAARRVYFEQWTIDALARLLSKDEALKPWIPARPTPVATVRSLTVSVPFRHPLTLTKEEMAVFRACDGKRAAHHLSELFSRADSQPQLPRDRLNAILEKLHSLRLIALSYELPLDPYPERRLREQLELVEDESVRRRAMAPLEQLEAGRDAVSAAAGDADRLRCALLDLEAHFTALTGVAPNRSPGEMYSGRTLVYEDCRRNIEVKIGQPILEALGPPLTLIFSSARWVTWQAGRHCRTILSQAFKRVAQASRSESVGFTEFYNVAHYLLKKQTLIADIVADMQRRWAEILPAPPGANQVSYSSQALKSRVAETFDAPGPGWPGACYQCPDLMIAASSLEAIQAGNFQFVLGELHMGANTLRGQCLVEQHPHADDIFRGVDADLQDIRLTPITPRRYTQRAARIYPTRSSARQFNAATTLDSIPPFGSTSFPAASLKVRKCAGRLVVEVAGHGMQFDALQSFASVLALMVVNQFSMLPPSPHTPRIVFDKLIVAREAWRFAPEEMEFAARETSAERFLAARRWRKSHSMPRWVFVKIPSEGKPIYLDFDSPVGVDILARRVRNRPRLPSVPSQITVTEMSPSHGDHWLTDSEGNRYSGELRIVAVDRPAAHGADQETFARRIQDAN